MEQGGSTPHAPCPLLLSISFIIFLIISFSHLHPLVPSSNHSLIFPFPVLPFPVSRLRSPFSVLPSPCPYSPKSRLNFCFNSFRIGFFCIIICSFSVSEKNVRSDSIFSRRVVNSILEFLSVILNQDINSGFINLISSS